MHFLSLSVFRGSIGAVSSEYKKLTHDGVHLNLALIYHLTIMIKSQTGGFFLTCFYNQVQNIKQDSLIQID